MLGSIRVGAQHQHNSLPYLVSVLARALLASCLPSPVHVYVCVYVCVCVYAYVYAYVCVCVCVCVCERGREWEREGCPSYPP